MPSRRRFSHWPGTLAKSTIACRVGSTGSPYGLRKTRQPLPTPAREMQSESDPFADVEWRDVRGVLDEELNCLPAKWRTPLVLCYLEGLTRDEAAAQIQCSLRTLHRNLADGRARLRDRLIRRGLAPAVLATVVLASEGLAASVDPKLIGKTMALTARNAAIPPAVRARLIPSSPFRGIAMKLFVSGLLLSMGVVTVLSLAPHEQAVTAAPIPPVTPSVLVRAPRERQKPPADPLADKVKEAQKKAIEYLKGHQKEFEKGVWNWEDVSLNLLQPGGTSALALLALLESGLKSDDEVVARGLKYLRTLEPRHTYVVSLQTQVLCKANQKKDADLIKRNVEWLEKAAVWNGKNLEGWSYQSNGGNRADHSNTGYAIAALYAANKAGFKVKKAGFWQDVESLYLRFQCADGSWAYMSNLPKGTHTMTLSGLACLLSAKDVIGKQSKASSAALKAGHDWIAKQFTFKNSPHTFYNIDLIAAVGRATGEQFIDQKTKKRDWYKEGAEWLIQNQKPGGEWQIKTAIDNFPVVSTSFALRFLASRPD